MHIPILAAGSPFDPLYNALGWVLAFLYSLIPNLGVSIILLTLVIMLVLYPLTAKQAKSMLAMQRVQPEIKKLQAKHKGDRQKLNEEVMKFYQENKINPLAGCLPLLVQLPIFFTLFRVLRDPFKHIPKKGSFSSLYSAFCGGVHGKCATSNVHHLKFIGIDLQKTATDSHSGALGAAPYFFLVALVVFTGYLQTRQAQSRTPAANKQMATVMKVLPVFFGLISLQFPAGLVLYFFISNLFRVGQQELIFRRIGTVHSPPTAGKLAGDRRGIIDVPSKTRDKPEPEAEPVDADEPESPAPQRSKGKQADQRARPQREPRPARPAREPRRPATRQPRSGGGGLRAMFQLPPPPEGNGGGKPTGGAPAARGGGTSGARRPSGTGRPPPQQRRRSSKKKRKR